MWINIRRKNDAKTLIQVYSYVEEIDDRFEINCMDSGVVVG